MGQDLSVILKKSQGRVTSLASTWSEAVCFLVVPPLAAGKHVALGGSVAGGGRSSTERPCVAETYGDKNGYNARKRRKSDAGYIHGGGSVAWRGGAGVARCREKRRRLHTARPTPPLKPARARRAPSAVRVVAASRGTKRLAP